MKTLAALAALLLAASQLPAQNPPGNMTPTDGKTAPDEMNPVNNDEAKPEPEPKIPGTTIVRDNGTFLGLEVVEGRFKLSFYDKKKKPMAPDVTRANARWPDLRNRGDNRTVLNPDGNALIGAKPVVPPYTWNVYLTLLQGEGENAEAVENYVVPFRG